MSSLCIRKLILLLAIFSISIAGYSQYYNSGSGYWKQKRSSIGFGIGATNFLGELGGRDQVGTDFLNDFEFSQTRPSVYINFRYQLNSFLFAKANFLYGILAGNDNTTEETFRMNRNLHFRSHIFELSAQFEINILDFTNKSLHDRVKANFFTGSSLYAFAGVGAMRFNPQATFNNDWYNLHNLGTEGQNQLNGPEPYSRITLVFPVGFGFRWEVNPLWSFGLEAAYRPTLSDYIDDVSGNYFDNDAIKNSQGEIAAYFADPSLGFMYTDGGDRVPLNSTFTGAQRGDPDDNDAYVTVHITGVYKLAQKRYKRHKGKVNRRKKRRIVF